MQQKLNAVLVIISINAMMFIVTQLPGNEEFMTRTFALYFPLNPDFKAWQLLTNMFMHGGISHIIFNMYGLYAFGSLLEQIWGTKRFVFFYIICGLGAGVIYLLVNYYKFNSLHESFVSAGLSAEQLQTLLQGHYSKDMNIQMEEARKFYSIYASPALGASGAIYGILVAFGMLFPNAKLMLIFLPVPIAAKYFIPALVALDLFSGVTGISIFGGGIAHFAHIGGALIGFILMLYWRKKIPVQLRHDNGQDTDFV